ncbi:MAG: hypothetical protein E6Q97_17775 [Desulfurellales bacterium]|nr:MAG: hypothetical protein E6Q97_17775 [Desulfurellales bacterium]
MPQVRPGATDKWNRRTAAASADYKAGVENSPNNWEQNTVAAAAAHKAGTEAALREGRFEKGVKKSGGNYYKMRAATIGADRFSSGVEAGKANYEEGVKPYLETIASTNLPPRGPKGDPRNYDRVKVMGEALRKKKIGGAA